MKKSIRILLAQTLISRIVGATEIVALNWWVFATTGSATLVGVVTFARLVPLLVASPSVGSLADRLDPIRILSFMLFAGSILTMASAALMLWGSFWVVVAVVGVRSLVTSAEPTIRSVTLARFAGASGLMRSMSTFSATMALSQAVGPLFAGLAMAKGGPELAIASCGVGTAVAAGLTMLLPRSVSTQVTTEGTKRAGDRWKSAGADLVKEPRLGAQLVLAAGPVIAVFPYTSLMPILSSNIFEAQADRGVVYLATAGGLGTFIGALILRYWERKEPRRVAYAAAIALSAPLFALSISMSIANGGLCVVMVCVLGVIGQLFRTSNRVATLLIAPDERLGFFVGISQTDRILIPVGVFVMGMIADSFGVNAMILAMAVGNCVFITPALFIALRVRH